MDLPLVSKPICVGSPFPSTEVWGEVCVLLIAGRGRQSHPADIGISWLRCGHGELHAGLSLSDYPSGEGGVGETGDGGEGEGRRWVRRGGRRAGNRGPPALSPRREMQCMHGVGMGSVCWCPPDRHLSACSSVLKVAQSSLSDPTRRSEESVLIRCPLITSDPALIPPNATPESLQVAAGRRATAGLGQRGPAGGTRGLRGDGAMCTTALLLGTLVVMLRRRFSNKVEPYVLLCPGLGGPHGWGQGSKGGLGVDGSGWLWWWGGDSWDGICCSPSVTKPCWRAGLDLCILTSMRARRTMGGSAAPVGCSPPAPPPGSAGGFHCRHANLFTDGGWRHLKVGRSNWCLMSQLSQGMENRDREGISSSEHAAALPYLHHPLN